MSNTTFSGQNAGLAGADPAVPATRTEIAILVFLLALFCLRVWGLGVTHTDDAFWVLRMYEGINPAADWARAQGRVWALPIGTMMQHTLMWQNSIYAEVLRLGSFVLFFAAFHWLVRVYCGARLALLCATLFLAFSTLRWDGSILTTYPQLTWVSGVVLVCAILLGRAYVRDGKLRMLAGAGAALYLALFNNEGVTVLFAFLFFLGILANAIQLDGPERGLIGGRIPRRSWYLLLLLAGISLLYAATYLGWRALHPAVYDGFGMAPFNLKRIALTLTHFSTSGSVLHDLIAPYSIGYVDAVNGNIRSAQYRIADFSIGLQHAPLALLVGGLLAWLGFGAAARAAQTSETSARKMALVAGLSIAILPILPVVLTAKYQGWAMELGVKAYSHTMLANFGWSLFLAGAILMLLQRVHARPLLRKSSLALLVLACAVFGTLNYRANDEIANDMRPEAGRWRIVETALAMNSSTFKAPLLWIPRLASGSWFTVLPDEYWSNYAKARYAVPTRISALAPEMSDAQGGFVMLDYAFENDGADVITLATQFRSNASRPDYAVEKIAVHFKRPNALSIKDYALAYKDGAGKEVRIKLTELEKAGADSALRVLVKPPADAQSIRVLRVGADGKDVEICSTRLAPGLRVMLGKEQIKGDQLHLGSFLLTDGWYPIERTAVWSKGTKSMARIPAAMLPAGDVRLRFDLSTFTGLGFFKGTQTVVPSVQGQKLAEWVFTTGAPVAPETVLTIPAALRSANGDLDLQFEVTPSQNPKTLGLSPDDRELGLQLRGVVLEPIK